MSYGQLRVLTDSVGVIKKSRLASRDQYESGWSRVGHEPTRKVFPHPNSVMHHVF